MAKFKKGDKVRIKDNPIWMCGFPVKRSDLTPGTVVEVDTYTPDTDGDILVKFQNASGNDECAYVREDCVELVETNPQDVRVGDRIRAYNKLTETAYEGVVKKIDDNGYVWVGKGYDIAYNQSNPDLYEVTVLERAERWPDHEGFIRITSGLNAGQRGLARQAIFSDQILIDTDDGRTLYEDTVAGQDFDFEYVEG